MQRAIWNRFVEVSYSKSKPLATLRVSSLPQSAQGPSTSERVAGDGGAALGEDAVLDWDTVLPQVLEAIVEDGANRFVLRVVDGRVRRSLVELGELEDGMWLVESGLTGGETVVVSPDPALEDGQAVRLAS